MAYIEENLKLRRGDSSQDDTNEADADAPFDIQEELFRIDDKYKVKAKMADEGNVTNSMAMLTAIPEVDLGMESVIGFSSRYLWLSRLLTSLLR